MRLEAWNPANTQILSPLKLILLASNHCIIPPLNWFTLMLASQVSHSWVAGKKLLDNRQLCSIDEHGLIQKTEQWRNRIQAT